MQSAAFVPAELPETFTENDWIPAATVPAFPITLDEFVIRNLEPIGAQIWDNQLRLWVVRDLANREIWIWNQEDAPEAGFTGSWGEEEMGVSATVGNLQVTWIGPPSV